MAPATAEDNVGGAPCDAESAVALPSSEAAAIAAAEAAADALFASDALDVTAGGAASDVGGDGGGTCVPVVVDDRCAELRQRAAAAALLDELRMQSAKSARLEKIISRLMGELRAAKLHAVGSGAGQAALASFDAATCRLEAAMRDTASSVDGIDGTLRAGFEAVAERLHMLDAARR
jgi:hypothetical protein